MMDDRTAILDPPSFPTTYTHDDTPEALGDDFELTVEERARISRAAQWGRSRLLSARAGDSQALAELRQTLHLSRWETVRS